MFFWNVHDMRLGKKENFVIQIKVFKDKCKQQQQNNNW